MKKFTNGAAVTVTIVMVLGLVAPTTALAVTPPDLTLGITATYSVYGSAGVTNTGGGTSPTRLWGNVGENAHGDGSLTAVQVPSGIIDNTGPTGTLIEGDASSVYDSLMSDLGRPLSQVLNIAGTHTGVSAITPGVYTIGAVALDGAVELSGAGVYIFRSSSTNAIPYSGTVTLTNGATPCNVWWAAAGALNLGSAQMQGNIIAATGLISMTSGGSLVGRAISLTKQVTLDNNQITQPTCTAATPAPVGGAHRDSTINVVKTVINDSGGTKTVADFPLFINGVQVTSGATTNYPTPGGVYTVTETNDPGYVRTFSGDCDVNGNLTLTSGDNKFCIITNNDVGAPTAPVVPPLIDVVKVPSPLALPGGPGPVTYTYTVRNVGTVPMTNVTMVGDTCSPIVRVSGDTNGDSILQTNETWTYTCTTTLAATHTNTVIATGWANGISAVDIASATVVVGAPIVPPLIHVTKVPSPLALSAAGGAVTYTEKITNPGTVALSNVNLTDDKCAPLRYVSGDINGDSMLQSNETWTYTCRANLAATTTNTATATGTANGLSVRDIAVATVVVAAPRLPSTGFPPEHQNTIWALVVGIALITGIPLALVLKRRMIES